MASGTFPAGAVSISGSAQRLTLNATNTASITSFVGNGTLVVNGGVVDMPAPISSPASLTINGGTVTAASWSGPGTVTVNAPGTLSAALLSIGGIAGNGSISISNNLFFFPITPSTFTFDGVIQGTGFLVKDGVGTLVLAGTNTYTGGTNVVIGTLAIEGSVAGDTFVGVAGQLTGAGAIGGALFGASPSSIVAPTGILSAASFETGGVLGIDIAGNTAGAGYDRVDSAGTVVLLAGATLALAGSYAPVAGDTFMVVRHGGAAPVSGTFAGLAEGATIPFNGRTLRITYTGGTGNDIVLSTVTHTVTPSTGPNGAISPATPFAAAQGGPATLTLTPAVGYSPSVGGTCGGALVGNVFTTAPITADCTVVASFTLNTYTVTPSAGANGTIAPSTPQVVSHGSTASFTLAPVIGYGAVVGGTCGGTHSGTTYTTNPITASCTVDATFDSLAVTTFSAPSATGSGKITASFTGGGPLCSFATSELIPVSGHARSPPAGSAPSNVAFPHGLFDFTLSGCAPGSTIAMTVTYPSPLPAGTLYWKYGPEPGVPIPHWYILPATMAGAVATFTITDGGRGDDDLAANGAIVDQGGPGVPGSGDATQIPTLSQWMLLLLAGLILLAGAASTRRERAPATR
jgi:autotransporter-associated beta strand protein